MQNQLKIGLLGLMTTLALIVLFNAIFRPYSQELRGSIEWRGYNPSEHVKTTLIIGNASFVPWYESMLFIRYDGVEYTRKQYFLSDGTFSYMYETAGGFLDENGNELDFSAAMNNNATVEILAKRDPEGEYEAVRIYRVLTNIIPITVTTGITETTPTLAIPWTLTKVDTN